MLGIFLLHLDGISQTNGTVSAVNSTAVVSNVQLSYNDTTLKCSENADLSMFSETVLRVAGECNTQALLNKSSKRTHTLCALSMHFQSTACHGRAVITTLLLLVFCTAHANCLASLSSLTEAEPEIPSVAYMYK